MNSRVDRLDAMFKEMIRLSDHVHQFAGQDEETFDRLRTQITHVRLAIDNIAWLAYIDMKKLPGFWEKKVNVARQIGACIGAKSWMIRDKYLHIHREFEDIEIEADPDLTRVIWENLVDNSIKYTNPHGNIWVTVKVVGKSVEISFRDDGAGIPADKLANIFDRFFEYSNEYQNQGLGTGLSAVKEGVLWLGGQVSCTSRSGEGTTILVRLPINCNVE